MQRYYILTNWQNKFYSKLINNLQYTKNECYRNKNIFVMRQKIDMKKSEMNERICLIRQVFFGDSNREFATKIGESEQNLSNICSPDAPRNASLTIIKKILLNMPTVNARWLITGEGSIDAPETTTQQVTGDNSGIIVQRGGRDNTYTNGNSDLLALVQQQQDTIAKQAEQIVKLTDRLLER